MHRVHPANDVGLLVVQMTRVEMSGVIWMAMEMLPYQAT
jgi:hypothetical protein